MTITSQLTAVRNVSPPHGTDDSDKLFVRDSEAAEIPLPEFDKGFSDDEGQSPTFGCSFEASAQKEDKGKGRKSPRRSDAEIAEAPRSKRKKTSKSFFGGGVGGRSGPFDQSSDEDDADDEGPSKTFLGIRGRMSSLAIDKEDHAKDNGEGSSKPLTTLLNKMNESDREPSPALSSRSPSLGLSEQLDEGDYSIPGDDPVASYGLRKNINRYAVETSWVDFDRSGDFDPAEEARKEAQRRNEAKARKQGKTKAKDAGKQIASAALVRMLIVKLSFKPFGTVLNVTNGEESCPKTHEHLNTEQGREQAMREGCYRCRTTDINPQTPIKDPLGEMVDLTGHPEARGCISCRRLLQGCAAIRTGQFPCAECKADDIVCVPIIEPKSRGRCNHCTEKGIAACSFEVGGPSTSFCDECFHNDTEGTCQAGPPAGGYRTDRIDIDRLFGAERKHLHCTNCRANKLRCSLKKKTQKTPCSKCKQQSIPCTFYETPVIQMSKKEGKRKVGESSKPRALDSAPDVSIPDSSFFTLEDMEDLENGSGEDRDIVMREATPEMETEDVEGRMGKTGKLRTSFAHPIIFHTLETNTVCSFCEVATFSFVGHWEKEVYVLKWNNGLGYTEIASGHRENEQNTVMCQQCVMERVQTIYCPEHDIQPMLARDTNYDAAVSTLLAAVPGTEDLREQLRLWCSMCFSLAEVKCCTQQPSLADQRGDEEDMVDGCGFRLCSVCYEKLKEVFGGDADAMATAYELGPKPKEGDEDTGNSIRADAGFLRREGLLMANVGAAANGVEEELGWGEDV